MAGRRRRLSRAAPVLLLLVCGCGSAAAVPTHTDEEDPDAIPQAAPHRDDFRGTLIEVPGGARWAWRCTARNELAFAVLRPRDHGPADVTAVADGRQGPATTVEPGGRIVLAPRAYRSVTWTLRSRGPIGTDRVVVAARFRVAAPPGVCLVKSLRVSRTFDDNYNG